MKLHPHLCDTTHKREYKGQVDVGQIIPFVGVRRGIRIAGVRAAWLRRRLDMRGWTEKDERQFDHIKESAEERGASEGRAEEIA